MAMAAAVVATVSIAAAPAAPASRLVAVAPANARLSCSFLGCGSVAAGGAFLPAAALWQCRLSPIQPEKARFCVTAAAAAAAMDDEVEMSPEEITRAYEELYGPSWDRKKSTEATSGMGDDDEKGPGRGRGRRGDDAATGRRTGPGGGAKDGLEESVVQVRRVTKVVKGGKQLSFRVVSVVGDKKGKVGVGVGKAKEVISAVQKSVKDARRHMVTVPMTKYKTFPHRADGHYGAADVMLRPASPGTGVIAGGSVRIVLEMAGIVNALGKQMGSDNCLNNARATLHAVSQMRHYKEVAELRGIPVEQLYR